jgi:DHA1 family vesicular acetylcholine transporter-like MFS transporter 3
MPTLPIINKDLALIGRSLNEKIHEPKHQRNLVLLIVCVALLLDNMLYMVIVPIIPEYLRKIHEDDNILNRTITVKVDYSTKMYLTSTDMQAKYPNGNMELMPGNLLQLDDAYEYEDDDDSTTTSSKKPSTLLRTSTTKVSKNDDEESEDVAVGFLFASKAIVQLIVNPFSGAFIDRVGYDIPMCIGLCIIFLSTTTFAFGQSYSVLFMARSLQGVGSAFADTAGLAMIADRFTQERERSTALGVALAFISFGSLVAPPFGGVLYEHFGKRVPFIALAMIALFDGLMLFLVMRPHRIAMTLQQSHTHKPKGTPIWRLFIDPYIAICAGALVMANVSLSFLEPTISIWMKNTMNATESQMGYIWLPGFIPHVFGVYFTVWMGRRAPQHQWLLAALGLALEGVSCFIIPFCRQYGVLMIPISGICFGIALVDTALLPTLGYLVDVRHTSVYGSIYAIADISYSLAFAVGPIMAGNIVHQYGFMALNIGICISNLLYAPVLYMLRGFYEFKPLESEELDAITGHRSAGTARFDRSNDLVYTNSSNLIALNDNDKEAKTKYNNDNWTSNSMQSTQNYKRSYRDRENLIDHMDTNMNESDPEDNHLFR